MFLFLTVFICYYDTLEYLSLLPGTLFIILSVAKKLLNVLSVVRNLLNVLIFNQITCGVCLPTAV